MSTDKFKSFLDWVKEWHSNRLIFGVLSLSKDEHKTEFDVRFASAKALSDFVGMIVRLAFVNFAMRFFLIKAQEAHGQWKAYVYGFGFTFALGLLFVFSARIAALIFLYETRSISIYSSKTARVIFLVISMIVATAVWLATNELATEIATSMVTKK